MNRIVFSQIFAGNGKTNYLGLYDENGLPVQVEVEVNDEALCGDDDQRDAGPILRFS